MSVLLPLCLFLSLITYSNALYCVCKDGNEQVLQKAIDYACGAGADCSQIQLNGACYQPNTVKNHCDVAVNSYYQKKASSGATCDFNGAATTSPSPPSTASSCLTGSSSSGTPSTGTPSTGTPTTGTPTSGTPTSGFPSTGTPTTGTPTTGTPSTGMPNTGTPSTSTGMPSTSTGMPNSGTPANGMPTSSSSSVFPGTTLGPTGLGDPNAGEKMSVPTNTVVFLLTGVAMLVTRV
uniref:Plasmodesmata callose-binding protein 4 n=2 Tax=Noccaea caerulescens TaxID=107243 RepID=A0A1J3IHQ1_NOCCA